MSSAGKTDRTGDCHRKQNKPGLDAACFLTLQNLDDFLCPTTTKPSQSSYQTEIRHSG